MFTGRGDETRTHDPMVPNHVRYQTALHPANTMLIHNTLKKKNCQTFFKVFSIFLKNFLKNIFLHFYEAFLSFIAKRMHNKTTFANNKKRKECL